jgi:hypothetical protein
MSAANFLSFPVVTKWKKKLRDSSSSPRWDMCVTWTVCSRTNLIWKCLVIIKAKEEEEERSCGRARVCSRLFPFSLSLCRPPKEKGHHRAALENCAPGNSTVQHTSWETSLFLGSISFLRNNNRDYVWFPHHRFACYILCWEKGGRACLIIYDGYI